MQISEANSVKKSIFQNLHLDRLSALYV